jgi:three-Cys-motif partner protein
MKNSEVRQVFGSDWTELKLAALKKYLDAYRQIFVSNASASYFKTWYVDAFAGSGERFEANKESDEQTELFDGDEINEDIEYKKGSASIALELEHPFDGYYFIEKKKAHADALKARIKEHYPNLESRCTVNRGDAVDGLTTFLASFNPRQDRAVVFLDPYGMSVEWHLISQLAQTKAVDLWLLFPHGMGVNRMLTQNKFPSAIWCDKLTRTFGTDEWKSRFYSSNAQTELFESNNNAKVKTANFDVISKFMIERLNTIFAGTCDKPIIIENSRGMPLYTLCFAVSNEKAKATAIRIASSISHTTKSI